MQSTVLIQQSQCLKGSILFPSEWLESSLFFIYKGEGSKEDPAKHRTISIQNPILKAFLSILKGRIAAFAEKHGIYPTFQFGFRAKRSTFTAAAIMYEIIKERLKSKQRTYACFVDFQKCFDKIDRGAFYKKLQIIGIPYEICEILHHIYANMKSFIWSGAQYSDYFLSQIGLPQGCCFSPVGFLLYSYDLGNCFTHKGV